jgi:CheY-like chemotaxis protein
MRFETALVVDDDPASRTVLRHLLELLGIRVMEAADGVEGLKRVHADAPELVVTDIRMPGMTGLELAEHLRNDGDGGAIQVVAVTRHPGDVRGSDLFDLILPKPVRASVLKSWIEG